ncbi:hypothetical protein [Salipiger sp. PrR003]|uniref:hypothetical protein n=1 Tax=Salipiger sp. PrR003 TaxID=2706776 RepID=UPI0013D921B2|nr:hypothetical protein [Salipiger sp. PrR003]NDV50155.1 hypothetical protein [Salipiger sp. PrR003]
MAYCKYSSDKGDESDVWVWADLDGNWITSVRDTRPLLGGPPHPLSFIVPHAKEQPAFDAAKKRRDEWERLNPPEVIEHPAAGQDFNHRSPGACAANLKSLKAGGIIVPAGVIEELEAGQAKWDARGDGDV